MVPVGMVLTALIAVVNLYGRGLQNVFGTTPIPGMYWGIPFSFAAGILIVDEIRKLIVRTYPKVSQLFQPLHPCPHPSFSPLSHGWLGRIYSSAIAHTKSLSN